MTILSEISLGVRLAAGGGRQALTRLLLMSAGVGLGVALLVGGLGIGPALQTRHAREFARQPVFVAGADRPADYLEWTQRFDRIGDQDVTVYSVRAVGDAPLPPGLRRLPERGEMFVSPSLAQVLTSPLGRIATGRLAPRIAGNVGPDGLAYPQELVAYVGVQESAFDPHASAVIRFGSNASAPRDPIPFGVKLLIITGVAGLLVPTLVFVATSTRLSAASRERRLAAIRLVGATPAQARLLAAVESGLAAAIGSVLGVALFFAFRPLVASLSLAGYRWFPSDIAPPIWQAVMVMLAAPALAVAASTLSLRRLILSPLGVARRARARRAGARRALPLTLGMAGLGLCWLVRPTVNRGGTGSLVLLAVSFVLVLVGLAAVAPWLGAAAGSLLSRGERGLGALLGARRLQADPTASGRVVAAMALLVFGAGLVHAFVRDSVTPGGDVAQLLRPNAVVIEGTFAHAGALQRRLSRVEGVDHVVPVVAAYSADGQGTPAGIGIWIADCADLRATLVVELPGCGPTTSYASPFGHSQMADVRPGAVVPFVAQGPDATRKLLIRVPKDIRTVRSDSGQWQLGTDLILPRSALVGRSLRHVPVYRALLMTDGQAATVERVRNSVAALGQGASAKTLQQARAGVDRTNRQITSLLDLGVLVAMGIALANLLVVSIDHVQERRRPVAVLAATGIPLAVLRRSVAVEIGLPVAAGVLLAVGLAVAVAGVFGAIVDQPMRIPLAQLGALAALTVATVAIVTALTFPALARAARPETLRVE
jgi:FtsX-like permease family protein